MSDVIAELADEANDKAAEIARLKAENDRLRELVRDMWPSYCWANTGYETFLTYEQDVEIRDHMRELRVEVEQ